MFAVFLEVSTLNQSSLFMPHVSGPAGVLLALQRLLPTQARRSSQLYAGAPLSKDIGTLLIEAAVNIITGFGLYVPPPFHLPDGHAGAVD